MIRWSTGSPPVAAPTFGVTWGGPPRSAARALTLAAATALVAGMAGPAAAAPAAGSPAEHVAVIVRELPGAGDRPEQAVTALGGTVEVESRPGCTAFTIRLPGATVTPREPDDGDAAEPDDRRGTTSTAEPTSGHRT